MPIQLHVFDDCFCPTTVVLVSLAQKPKYVLFVPSQKKVCWPLSNVVLQWFKGNATKLVLFFLWVHIYYGAWPALGFLSLWVIEYVSQSKMLYLNKMLPFLMLAPGFTAE